jgi:hypothetical protein
MLSSWSAHRIVGAVVVALGVLASSGEASAAAVFVDDDRGQCPGAFRDIHTAIGSGNLAPGDIVFVCPGTYREPAFTLGGPGVRVIGLTGNPADVVVRPKSLDLVGFIGAPVIMILNRPSQMLSSVTLEAPGCGPFISVFVEALDKPPFPEAPVVENVDFRSTVPVNNCASNTVGVQVGFQRTAAGSTAEIRHSHWTGFGTAIEVGPTSRAMIHDNVIAHNPVRAAEPGPPQQFGVHAVNATVDIFHNEVFGFRNFDPLTGVGSAGIRLDGAMRGRIGGGPTLDRINNIHNNYTGVLLASQGFTVAYNTIHHNNQIGILATFQASANHIVHNTVTNNLRRDCVDRSTGTGGVGTANTWFANVTIGARSSPQSICRPAGASTATTAAARFSARLAAAAAGIGP